MKTINLIILAIIFSLFAMTSCQKEGMEDLTEQSMEKIAGTSAEEVAALNLENAIEIKPTTERTTANSRSSRVKVWEYEGTLHHQDWYSVYILKEHLVPGCKYTVEVTPIHGNADAYVHGYDGHEYRKINKSTYQHDTDVAYGYYRDLHHDEHKMYFSAYGATDCQFKIVIYKEHCENTHETVDFHNIHDGQHFHAGDYLYAKCIASNPNNIEWMELYVDGHLVKRENDSPYEWGKPHTNNDHALNNMHAGTYELTCKAKTHNGHYLEKTITIYVDEHATPNYPTVSFHNLHNYDSFHRGEYLYVKCDAYDRDGIEWVELYVNGHLVRRETNAPYEWGRPHANDDHVLNNMHTGTYELTCKTKNRHGYIAEKTITIYVN